MEPKVEFDITKRLGKLRMALLGSPSLKKGEDIRVDTAEIVLGRKDVVL